MFCPDLLRSTNSLRSLTHLVTGNWWFGLIEIDARLCGRWWPRSTFGGDLSACQLFLQRFIDFLKTFFSHFCFLRPSRSAPPPGEWLRAAMVSSTTPSNGTLSASKAHLVVVLFFVLLKWGSAILTRMVVAMVEMMVVVVGKMEMLIEMLGKRLGL